MSEIAVYNSRSNKLLRRLGFVYKKQKIVPGKLDVDKQELFKLEYSLLRGDIKAKEAIYFMDSVHPQYQTEARCGLWGSERIKIKLYQHLVAGKRSI